MGHKAKNKQKAPEPIEKPKFEGLSKRAKARLNKTKAAAIEKNNKRQLAEETPKKNAKKAKTTKAVDEDAEGDLWDNLEVASDDENSDELDDEFDMSDYDISNDEDEEEEVKEEEEVVVNEEQDVFPKAEDDFLGSDSEEEMELDQEESEEADSDDDEEDEDHVEVFFIFFKKKKSFQVY